MDKYSKVFEILSKYGQTHLLQFYEELTEEQKSKLLEDIENTDFEEISNINKETNNKEENKEKSLKIEPITAFDKESLTDEELKHYKKIGEELIKEQRIAVCTMAGGQGSRLGHEGPKGTFIVPLKSPKSIFQIATEHMLMAYQKYGVYINWYIMTSEENDEVTKRYFEENNYFGYSKDAIRFFKQGQLPLTNFEGDILLQEKDKVFKAANGNGGIFKALEDNGILTELKDKKIEYLVTCNVDNILIKPIDSTMFGVMKDKNVELGIKSIIKRNPQEPVGVCCLKNGKPTVIEYIDLPKELAEETLPDGSLKFAEVHFGCNYLSCALLEKIAKEKLPYHAAKKKNKYWDKNGKLVLPENVNSIKYEMFIFDGFEKAKNAIVFRVKREEEFAPIKYKEGEDSPQTASKMYEAYWNQK